MSRPITDSHRYNNFQRIDNWTCNLNAYTYRIYMIHILLCQNAYTDVQTQIRVSICNWNRWQRYKYQTLLKCRKHKRKMKECNLKQSMGYFFFGKKVCCSILSTVDVRNDVLVQQHKPRIVEWRTCSRTPGIFCLTCKLRFIRSRRKFIFVKEIAYLVNGTKRKAPNGCNQEYRTSFYSFVINPVSRNLSSSNQAKVWSSNFYEPKKTSNG